MGVATPQLHAAKPTAGEVKINVAFPGGNVKVTQNQEGAVRVEPDLRGDNPWFYWYFEAQAWR